MKKSVEEKVRSRKIKLVKTIILLILTFIAITLLTNDVQAAEKFDDFYELQDETVTRILPETTVKDLKNNLENQNILVIDKDGNVVEDDKLVATGMKLHIDSIHTVMDYNISVVGDLDGNGKISITDLTKMKLNSVNLSQIEDEYKLAADIDNNGKITLTDLAQLNLALVNIKDIIAPESFKPTVTHTDNSITISGSTTDNSGKDVEYFFRLDDNEWLQNPKRSNGSYTFQNVDFNYVHFVLMKVKDKAGNEKKTEITILGEPNVSVSIIPSTTEWTNQNIEVSLEMTSNVLNTESYLGQINIIPYEKYTTPITIEKNGTLSAVIWKKQYGTLAQTELDVGNIDKLMPKDFDANVVVNLNEITINAETDDEDGTEYYGKSGIKEYEYIIKNGKTELKETTTEGRHVFNDLTIDGLYSVNVIVRDNAGNENSSKGQINTDFSYTITYEDNNATDGINEKTKKVTYNNPYGELAEPKRIYSVSYNTNGGSNVDNETVEYVFGGWYKEEVFENRITRDTLVTTTNNHRIYAKWEDKAIRLPVTTKNGYEFDGWYENNEFTGEKKNAGDTYVPTRNVILYAKWNLMTYTIDYELGAQNVEIEENPTTYTIEDDITLNNPTRTGYTLKGWVGSNGTIPETMVEIVAGSTGNREYEAVWQANKYTLTYDAREGEVNPESVTEDYGTEITLIEPTRSGYSFMGWYDNSNYEGEKKQAGDTITLTEDIVLYAKWEIIEYTITYNLGLEDVIIYNPTTYTVEDEIVLDNPMKVGYVFMGWTGSNGTLPNESLTIEQGSTGNKEYNAIWDTLKYRIDYELNGGEAINPTDYTVDSEDFTLNIPIKAGYRFIGWTGENGTNPNETITIVKGSIGNKAYEANWCIENYSITYNLDGGSFEIANPIGYDVDTESFTLNNPVKEGYTFKGWLEGNDETPKLEVTIEQGSTGNKEFTAVWLINQYTLTYNANSGEVNPESVTEDYGTEITLVAPTRTGYSFMGWYDNSEFDGALMTGDSKLTLTQDITLYAKWDANSYVITYQYNNATGNNGQTSKTIEYNELYGELAIPKQEYKATYIYNDGRDNQVETVEYIFDGWYKEEEFINKIEADTRVETADNHTLYAKWTTATTTTPSVGNRYGYNFIGWYETATFEGTQYAEGETLQIQKDITMYAKWRGIDFDVDYEYNGATSGNIDGGKKITFGEPYTDLPNPSKNYTITYNLGDNIIQTGLATYEFKGWYLDRNLTETNKITEGVTTLSTAERHTIYAKWNGDNIQLLTPDEKYGYEFVGWYETSSLTGTVHNAGENYQPNGNKTFYAKWNRKISTLTIDANGGTYSGSISKQQYVGETVKIPDPILTGYTFAGWSVTEGNGTINSGIFTFGMQNTKIKATWTLDSYTITYDLNGGIVYGENPTGYNTTTENITLINPIKTGYTFTGWTGSNGTTPNTNLVIKKGSVGNKTYTANWTENKSSLTIDTVGGTLTVTSSLGGTTTVTNTKTITQGYNSTLSIGTPTKQSQTETEKYTITYNGNGGVPSKTNDVSTKTITKMYSFAGWRKTLPFNGTLTESPIKYTYSNKANVTDIITATYSENPTNTTTSITLPSATREYTVTFNNNYTGSTNTTAKSTYTFDGWYTEATNGTKVTSPYTPTANTTLYAHWISKSVTLPTPTRNGYTFDGWYTSATSGTKITDSYTPTANATLYAHWKANKYTLTYDANGGSVSPTSKTVTYGETYGTLSIPTKTGYKLSGWYTSATGGTKIIASTKVEIANNHTIYAQWTPNTYTLTYNANGGSVSPSNKSLAFGEKYGTLPTPTRNGYVFNGWYTSASGGTKVNETDTITNNITIYAQWTPNTYTLILDANGGYVSQTSKVLTYGSTYGTLPIPTRSGYKFDGWYTSANSGSNVYASNIITGNTTIYAHWSVESFTVTYDANGGYVSQSSRIFNMGDIYGYFPTATRSGYTFDGWYTSAYGGNRLYISDKVTHSHTIYAHWIESKCTLTYDACGGSVYPTSTTLSSGSTYGTLPTPTRNGYTFDGWYTSWNISGTRVYSSDRITSDTTIYARWSQNTIKFTGRGARISGNSVILSGQCGGSTDSFDNYVSAVIPSGYRVEYTISASVSSESGLSYQASCSFTTPNYITQKISGTRSYNNSGTYYRKRI